MKQTILELVKHTGGLGFIDTVLVTSDDDKTLVEAMDADRSVIIKCDLKETVTELKGEFGMSQLTLLQGLLNHPNFKADEASIKVKRTKKDGQEYPEELVFTDAQGQQATFRLMNRKLVPEQAKFIGKDWDVELTPSKSKIQEFAQLAGLYSFIENHFQAKTVDGELRFYIGDEDSANHKAYLIIEKDLPAKSKLPDGLYWPIAQVLSILKLGNDDNMKMSFNGRGALQISIETDHAVYRYILPSKKKS